MNFVHPNAQRPADLITGIHLIRDYHVIIAHLEVQAGLISIVIETLRTVITPKCYLERSFCIIKRLALL